MIAFDPGQLVVAIVRAWRGAKAAHAWMRLVFSMIFSGVIAYYGTAGAALVAGSSPALATGLGYLAVAVSLLSLFLKSNLTRGMTISIPQLVARELQEKAGQTTIEKS